MINHKKSLGKGNLWVVVSKRASYVFYCGVQGNALEEDLELEGFPINLIESDVVA